MRVAPREIRPLVGFYQGAFICKGEKNAGYQVCQRKSGNGQRKHQKKFQDEKLHLVDEVIALDEKLRALKSEGGDLRAERNATSQKIGALMREKKKDEAEAMKKRVVEINERLVGIEKDEALFAEELKKRMMVIPNILDPEVPIGKDDSENVERERFIEPKKFDFEIPYHLDILEKLHGIDLDSARKVAGNGFYYLTGNIARLHEAVIAYARDFMIDKGFTYVIPPFMIRSNVVTGVMSFAEMDQMMYKIEGEEPDF